MKTISLAIGMLAAVVASSASAQPVNMTGEYKCVQTCRMGLVGSPAFVTQNGLNLLNEAGEPARAWPDWFAASSPDLDRRLERGRGVFAGWHADSVR